MREERTITLCASDDLLERAKKIVRVMGYRGAVGDYVLLVHEVLQNYAKLDAKRPVAPPTPGEP